MKDTPFAQKINNILKTPLPKAREIIAEGREIADGIEIGRTAFFEKMGCPTHLSDYSVGSEHFEEIVARLEARGMIPMGEKKNLDAARVREVLAMAR